jgi:mannose-6-phosphate isomerase-like protein (cupin superfamily)
MSRPETSTAVVRGADEGEAFNILNSLAIVKAAGEETNGSFGLVEQRSMSGHATPLHVHRSDDELFYVLEGQLTYHVDDEEFVADPDTTVFAPRGVPHAFRVDEDGSRWLDFRTGGKEQFFADVGSPVDGYEVPPADPPTDEMQARLDEHTSAYDMEILGPSPLVE